MNKINKWRHLIAAYGLEILGMVTYEYITNKITNDGLYADAHLYYTGGGISILDLTILGSSFLLLAGAAWLFWRSMRNRKPSKGNDKEYRFAITSTALSMAFLVLILVWPLGVVSAVLSLMSLLTVAWLTYEKSVDKYLLACAVINITVGLFIVSDVIFIFART